MFKHKSFSSTSFILGALMVTSYGASAAKMSLKVYPNQKYDLIIEGSCNAQAVKVRGISKEQGDSSGFQKFGGVDHFAYPASATAKCDSKTVVTVSLPASLIQQGQNLEASTYVIDQLSKEAKLRREVQYIAIPCKDEMDRLAGGKSYEMKLDFQKAPVCAGAKTATTAPAVTAPTAQPAAKTVATPTAPVAAASAQKEKDSSVKLVFSKNADGTLRYALIGEDVCKAEGFRFRILERKDDNRVPFYMSKGDTPRDTFAISKSSCSFNQTLSPDYIESGKILQVKTVKRKDDKSIDLVDVDVLFVEVPCAGDIAKALDHSREYNLSKDLKSTKCVSAKAGSQGGVSGVTPIVGGGRVGIGSSSPQQQKPQQSCRVSIKEVVDSRITFSASCSIAEQADVEVKQDGNVMYSKRHYLGPQETEVVDTVNHRLTSTVYTMRVQSVETVSSDSSRLAIRKKATFDHPVQGQYLTPETLKPSREKSWDGDFLWDTEIRVKVSDEDLEEKVGDEQILVELVDENGKRVKSQTVATGAEVKFSLRAQFNGFWSISRGWQDESLRPGTNKFKVLVYEAYDTDKKKEHLTLKEVEVLVPKSENQIKAD